MAGEKIKGYTVEEKHIFLSYSRKDENFAFRFRDDLVKEGLNVWMDQTHIVPGEHWDDTIDKALKGSSLLIVIVSPNSAKSRIVRSEVLYAYNHDIPFIPIDYKKAEIPFWWTRHQFIELHEDNYEIKFSRVLDAIQKQLQQNDIPLQKTHMSQEYEVNETTNQNIPKEKPSTFWKYSVFVLLILLSGGAFYLYHIMGGVEEQKSILKEKIPQKSEVQHTVSSKKVEENISFENSLENVKKELIKPKQKSEKLIQPDTTKTVLELDEQKIEVIPKQEVFHEIKKLKTVHTTSHEEKKQSVIKKKGTLQQTDKETLAEKEVVLKKSMPKPMIQKKVNVPYDRYGIVEEFVERLDRGEDIAIVVKVHSKPNEDIDQAYERVYNLEELLIKKGIAQDRVESDVINDQKGGISYEIKQKVD